MKRFYSSSRQHLVRWSLVLAVVISSTMLLVSPAQASAEHCIHPNGTDLNVLYGISAQLVNPFCKQVDSGEYWVATGASPWLVNTSFEAIPEGFVPAGSTPLEDFHAKFVGVKYVIDAGTRQERAYFIANNDRLWTSTFAGLVAVHPATLGRGQARARAIAASQRCKREVSRRRRSRCRPADIRRR